jgi:thiol-disulfide isomerase/thioredoxin
LNRPLPEDVLENTYLTSFEDNSRISLAALLDKYKNQPVYIDFWASWCGACREDIRVAAEAREFLKEQHVAYVYISIDKQENKSAWKNAAMKDGITKDQYLIDKDVSSLLAKHLKINFIPRYILLGKDHTVKNLDAPRPTPYQFADLRMIVNAATGKVYRYN